MQAFILQLKVKVLYYSYTIKQEVDIIQFKLPP
jgi:hypothetical protein